MNSYLPNTRPGGSPQSLQLIVLYTDFPAGVRAKHLTDQIAILTGGNQQTFVQFWKLDSIPDIGPLKETIVRDASAADALIFATSAPAQDESLLASWLQLLSVRNSQRLVPGLLMGVLGDETTGAAELDRTLPTLFEFADRARWVFVWQNPGAKTTPCPARIADSFKQLTRCKLRASSQRLTETTPWEAAGTSSPSHEPRERLAAAAP